MGKSYAQRNTTYISSKGDYYPTPYGLTRKLVETGELKGCKNILEPSCGSGAISNTLEEYGFKVTSKDIVFGDDFLADDYTGKKFDAVVTNPPFSLWDKFVNKAKTIDCKKIIFIGRTNFFGSHSRNVNEIWKGLSDVYVFDRQVAYDRELRSDGKMYCGCLITGWFIWTKGYKDYPRLHIVDVNNLIARKGE